MSDDPHDHLLLQIRGAVAEYERTLIAERMRRGRLAKLRAGALLPWTYAPYGYRLSPDRPRDPAAVQIEPAEAAVVAELFALYREPDASLLRLALHHGRSVVPQTAPDFRRCPGRRALRNLARAGFGDVTAPTPSNKTPRSPARPLGLCPLSRRMIGQSRA